MDKLSRLMARNGIASLRKPTEPSQEARIAELERTIEILLKGEVPQQKKIAQNATVRALVDGDGVQYDE